MSLLEIKNLKVAFSGAKQPFTAVDNLSLSLERGEIVGIVGESGSGKSVASLAIMGLIDAPGHVQADALCFNGEDLQGMSMKARRSLLGKEIAMIFQDPMTSLDPSFTLGYQMVETLKAHHGGRKKDHWQRACALLEQVGIPDPESRLVTYPHQLSGGMSQRILIAMAIACNPKLLIADEPTTALDVTIQAQIMKLLREIQQAQNMALMLITHDLAVVAENCQRIVVMYAGQIVEMGHVIDIFRSPKHPYTEALLKALPERAKGLSRLHSIGGVVPGAYDRPKGCLLNPRCAYAKDRCFYEPPLLTEEKTHQVRCHFPLDERGFE